MFQRLTMSTRAEDEGVITYVFLQQRSNPREHVLYEQCVIQRPSTRIWRACERSSDPHAKEEPSRQRSSTCLKPADRCGIALWNKTHVERLR
jgi:hypothetical protein